ncbi:MAG TPA: FAD-dependent oxidoreductase [Conexibacter sp.]|nr:FAD-dependent oxidoreductase [Conexibacter sp.]
MSALPFDPAALRSAVRGPVALPGEPEWDAARQAWNLAADQRPAAILHATGPDDVIAAIGCARRAGLRVAPQGVGHGATALGPLDGTLLLRTTRMAHVDVDAAARRARVESGAAWGPVAQLAGEHGLAALHGSSPTVGVAGYTLGGGLGWLARQHGLASEAVTAIELVTADGRLRRATAEEEPELFWALRGGGGGFGVVTALEFELFPLAQAYGGGIFWPGEHAVTVMRAYRDWAATLPDSVSTTVRLLRLPPFPQVPEPLRDVPIVDVGLVVAGDEESGAELVAPLLAATPPPVANRLAPLRAPDLAFVHGDPEQPVPGLGHHTLLRELPDAAIDALAAVAGAGSGSPLLSVELRQLGGALGRRAPDSGALGALDAAFALYGVGIPAGPEVARAVQARLDAVVEAVAPWRAPTGYLNFADRPGGDSADLFDGATHARLLALKREVDPEGLIVSGNALTLPA